MRGFPSPSCRRRVFDTTWGGVRGGGNPHLRCSAIPPSLSLPHKGGGDAAARFFSSSRVGAAGDRLTPFLCSARSVECAWRGRRTLAPGGGRDAEAALEGAVEGSLRLVAHLLGDARQG